MISKKQFNQEYTLLYSSGHKNNIQYYTNHKGDTIVLKTYNPLRLDDVEPNELICPFSYLIEPLILSHTSHPNIVKYRGIFSSYQEVDLPDGNKIDMPVDYLLLEQHPHALVWLADCDVAKAISLFKQLVSAVSYLHSNGIHHNDINAYNVVCNQDYSQAYLIDFDLATIGTQEHPLIRHHSQFRSWHPPELLDNKPLGPTADVWGIALLFIQMLTGFSRNIEADSRREFTKYYFRYMDPRSRNYIVSSALEKHSLRDWEYLIYGMLKTNPQERWTIQQVSQYLGLEPYEKTIINPWEKIVTDDIEDKTVIDVIKSNMNYKWINLDYLRWLSRQPAWPHNYNYIIEKCFVGE
jgi:serine/threonine protein kinase